MRPRAVGDQDRLSSTFFSVAAAYALTLVLSISCAAPTSALQTVPRSPCADICSSNDLNLANDTVCLDDDYQTGEGQQFRQCTTCLLNSTAVDSTTNISDVYWGLFNLRYTISECIFAYPAEIVSISNPCQVLCSPLQRAATYGIGGDKKNATDSVVPNLDFCNNGFGPDDRINNCSFCYSYIPQQLFMSNFMQALHIACRQPPAMGDTFYPDGRAIFNESAIPGPAPPGPANSGKSGLTGWKLGLVIALPIVGGTVLFGLTCFCCFKFTKKRRVRMAATGRMSTYYDRNPVSATSNKTPPSQYEWPLGQHEPAQEMERISHVHTPKSGKMPSPGLAQGRWSHHADDDIDTPVSAFPRDDVGPGSDQAKDPYLHEQYFGVTGSTVVGEAMAGPSGQGHPDERGTWAR